MATRAERDLALWQTWKQDPKPETLEPILDNLQGSINAKVNEFRGAPVPTSAIRGFANTQAVKALHTYNPGKGASVNTFVNWHLKKTKAFVLKHQNIGRIPEHRARNITEFKNARSELTEKMGRPPDSITLSEHLGWNVAEVGRMQKELRADHIASVSLEPDDMLNDLDAARDADVMRYIHYELPPDEKLVYEYSLGLYGRPLLSATDIAKTMGISAPKVSRLRKSIDQRLQARGS